MDDDYWKYKGSWTEDLLIAAVIALVSYWGYQLWNAFH